MTGREGQLEQVPPLGVHAFHQGILLIAAPPLDLLLPGNGIHDVACRFEIHQFVNVVFRRETGNESILVGVDPAFQVTRDADVHDPVILACQ